MRSKSGTIEVKRLSINIFTQSLCRRLYVLSLLICCITAVQAAQPVREVGQIEGGIKFGMGKLMSNSRRVVSGQMDGVSFALNGHIIIIGDAFFSKWWASSAEVYQRNMSYDREESPLFGFGQAGLEVRYNFPHSGFDAGIEAMFLGMRLKQTVGTDPSKVRTYGAGYFGAVSNYNILQGGKINPYAGVGLGAETRGGHFMVAPRVGVELWYHLRVEVGAYLGHRDANMLMVSVGGVIGGRPKVAK